MSAIDHEETNSSLGDSNYDILSNSTLSDDERDRIGDSVVSVQRPDDIDSLADTESVAGTTSTGAYTESNLSSSGILPATPTYSAPSEDGSQASRAEHRLAFVEEAPLTSPRIEFQEPQDLDESISVMHPVFSFDDEKTEQLVKQFDIAGSPTSLVATVRQTMSKQSLSLHEPFRILYTGNPVAKNDIIEKIGAALAASNSENLVAQAVKRRSSRFNVIPVSSFGGAESPEVALIDSFGLELVVDECTFAKNKRGGVYDEIHLHLNERFWCRSRRGENGLQMDTPLHWRPPHIGIFFCSESDTSLVRQTRHFARSFLLRHKIPFITISQNLRAIQQAETWSIDEDTLHMCLESEQEINKRLPVDLTTFLNIDARQMNRNLAHLTQAESSDLQQSTTSQTTAVPSGSTTLRSDSEKSSEKSAGTDPQYMKYSKDRATVVLVTLGLAFAFVLIGTILNVAFFNFIELSRNVEPLIHIVTSAPQIQSRTENKVSSIATSTTSANTALSTIATSPNSVSVGNLDLASLLFDPKNAANETDKFKVHILGDSHMIMLPPQRFNLLKSPPKVFVKVEKGEKVLDVKLSKLSDGVYSLALDLNDAYGVMNVSVWTKSKPKVSQKFELDFGTPWLKIVGWRRAADDLTRDLQARWSVATKGATDVQKYVAKNLPKVKVDQETCNAVLKKARLASKQLSKQVAQRGEEVRKDLLLRAGIVGDTVSRVVKDQVTTIQKARYPPFALKAWDDISSVVQRNQNQLNKVLNPKGEVQNSLRKAQAQAKHLFMNHAKQFQDKLAERKKARSQKKLNKKSCSNGKGKKGGSTCWGNSRMRTSSKAKKNR